MSHTIKYIAILVFLFPQIAYSEAVKTPKPLTLLSVPQLAAVCAALLNTFSDAAAAQPNPSSIDSQMTRLLMFREVWMDSSPTVLPVREMTELMNRALLQPKEDFLEQFSFCAESGAQILSTMTESKKFALLSRAVSFRDETIAKRKK